ncbi:MAG: rod shape-determining protein RodA [Flavobacteriales bacterium]|nr:rod shape-determining protein RodA [Flavobacteriales bacterium]
MRIEKKIFGNVDWISVYLYLLLLFFGWINIYASQYNDDQTVIFDLAQRHGKQLVFIGASLFVAFIILIIDWKFFEAFSYLLYGIIIFSLISLLIWGATTAGATSWFEIGKYKLQPSEFAKFTTILAVAKYLNTHNIKMQAINTKLRSFAIILVPLLLTILQNDLGTALVFFSLILMLYREGLSGNVLLFGLIISILFIVTLLLNKFTFIVILFAIALFIFLFSRRKKKEFLVIFAGLTIAISFVFLVNYIFLNVLAPHQVERINILLGIEIDPHGAGYNLIQSKIAIGSGGFFGKGFLKGTQTRFDFVPEQSTDFIFCTIGEEWGFFGSLIFIVVFVALLLRIINLAERQRSKFCRIYGYGVACILFVHFAINIGMTIGLAPVIGIPLPFISYGGSSLIGFTILLFIFLNLDSYRLQILR